LDSNRKRPIILSILTHRVIVSIPMRVHFVRVPRRALARALVVAVIGMTAAHSDAHRGTPDGIALGSLVDAELAFAKMGKELGVRAAFLAHFADEGVVFEPAPVRLREVWSTRPAPADPLGLRLEWKPAQAGVARSNDMGYTTGPFTLSTAADPENIRHGVFFSVWRRSEGGRWQVILDAGITTAHAADFVALAAAPRPGFNARGNAAAERTKLLALETAASALAPNAYNRLLAADVRLHRDESTPIASRADVAKEIARRMSRVSWTPLEAHVSAAADMAVTHGRYREVDRGQRAHDGYYAHLWLRDGAGEWRLAYDIALPKASP
jgi:ketosteroid isomerase-like protein